MQGLLLLDHDNIPFHVVSIRKILTAWIAEYHDIVRSREFYVTLRAYGGWYTEDVTSRSRSNAAERYQAECPSVLLLDNITCRTTFEFADRLLSHSYLRDEGPAPPFLTHTVAVRSSPGYFSRRAGASICDEVDCQLSAVRKWMKKKRACMNATCPHSFDTQFERYEQKQVDVHLAVDFLAAAQGLGQYDLVALASDDWDMLPALLAASSNRNPYLSLVRFTQKGSYLDDALVSRGIRLVTVAQE